MAAAAYDYEGDPRWAEYWSNVLIPPHMASRSDVVDHFKRKFYQRFIDPDFVLEPMTSTSTSSQSAGPSVRSSSSSATDNARPRSSGSGTATSAQPERNANSLQLDGRSIHFSVNAWVLVVAVLGILPIVPRHLSNKAYRLSLLGTTCSSFYSVYTLYGKPRAWNLPAIQVWFQTVIATKDFIHLIYCLMFLTSQLHFKLALIPVLCWALEHVTKFLRHNFAQSSMYRDAAGCGNLLASVARMLVKYLEEPCLWVEVNATTLGILSSNAEISLGFLLIVSLLSWQRNIIQTFMYWQLLKLMYHAPVTAGHHRSVWTRIGRILNPYIHRHAPFLNTPISVVQRWWFR